jgi:hypothetical protein
MGIEVEQAAISEHVYESRAPQGRVIDLFDGVVCELYEASGSGPEQPVVYVEENLILGEWLQAIDDGDPLGEVAHVRIDQSLDDLGLAKRMTCSIFCLSVSKLRERG